MFKVDFLSLIIIQQQQQQQVNECMNRIRIKQNGNSQHSILATAAAAALMLSNLSNPQGYFASFECFRSFFSFAIRISCPFWFSP